MRFLFIPAPMLSDLGEVHASRLKVWKERRVTVHQA